MEDLRVCYRFECAKYLDCRRAAGLGCCLEKVPGQVEVAPGECTKENGYPCFWAGREKNAVKEWLRGRM